MHALCVIYCWYSTHGRASSAVNCNQAPESTLPQLILGGDRVAVNLLSMCPNILSDSNANSTQLPRGIIARAFQEIPRSELEYISAIKIKKFISLFDRTHHVALNIHQSGRQDKTSFHDVDLLVILPPSRVRNRWIQ